MKSDKTVKPLSFFNVAALYVGTLMGAGFASGREGWQFFGVFGEKGYMGLLISGFLFMTIGMMVSYIARTKNTQDMGRIIDFTDSPKVSSVIGYIMAGILYTVIISMSAAGGAFLQQQFGIHKAIGGFLIVVLVIITVLGDFERISKVFRLITPALFFIDILLCILVIRMDLNQSGATEGFPVSAMAPNWWWAAIIFVCYNMLGMVPIVGEASVKAKSKAHGIFGAAVGGFMLCLLTWLLLTAISKDMEFTNAMNLPMLAYSTQISPLANVSFGIVLFAAIYSAATGTFYAFSTKVKEGPKKKYILIVAASIGFICGLAGFDMIVAYLYPSEGYIGILIILSITINFFRTWKEQRKKKDAESVIERNA